MAAKKEKEAFKQAALKMSRYRLRRALAEAGLDPKEIRDAEVDGEDEMVSVLVAKFEDGDIDMPGLEKAAGKSLSDDDDGEPKRKAKKSGGNKKASKSTKKSSGRKAKKKEEEEEPEDDEGEGDEDGNDDPYSSAFEDDEGTEDDESSSDDDGYEDDETDEDPPPRKAKKSAKKSTDDEKDGSEAMLSELMDMQLTMAEELDKMADNVRVMEQRIEFLVGESLLFHEIVKFAFARIWKLGAAKPLKPGFSDVIKKGRELLKKRFEKEED